MRVNDIGGFDFGLGETARMLRESVRGFAADKIAPRADEIDARTSEIRRMLIGRELFEKTG
jgi:isovaleryl-CoA dehydrogenase